MAFIFEGTQIRTTPKGEMVAINILKALGCEVHAINMEPDGRGRVTFIGWQRWASLHDSPFGERARTGQAVRMLARLAAPRLYARARRLRHG